MGMNVSWLHAASFEKLDWEALVPADWDPMQSFSNLQDLANLPDTDPRVAKLYEQMRKVFGLSACRIEKRHEKTPGIRKCNYTFFMWAFEPTRLVTCLDAAGGWGHQAAASCRFLKP